MGLCLFLELIAHLVSLVTHCLVEVILEVRNELLENNQQDDVWEGWTGDPCLPVPWNGIGCEAVNGDTVITKM